MGQTSRMSFPVASFCAVSEQERQIEGTEGTREMERSVKRDGNGGERNGTKRSERDGEKSLKPRWFGRGRTSSARG